MDAMSLDCRVEEDNIKRVWSALVFIARWMRKGLDELSSDGSSKVPLRVDETPEVGGKSKRYRAPKPSATASESSSTNAAEGYSFCGLSTPSVNIGIDNS